jgi:hypothetical protein
MIHVKNPEQLSKLVQEAIIPASPAGKTWWKRLRALMVRRLPLKIGALGLVSVLWLLLAGQQNFEVSLKVPLEIKNLPENMEVLEPVNPEVQITVRGLRKDAGTVNKRNTHAEIDLTMARFGNRVFRIIRDQIVLPNDRVNLIHVEPPVIEFMLKETER